MSQAAARFPTRLAGLSTLAIALALSTTDCPAVTAVSVTPANFTLHDETTLVTVRADTASPGNALIFDVHLDVDGDGNLDPQDGRFMSFEIVDGQVPHLGNEYYWHDEDGATDSSITATLTAYGLWWFSGNFIMKVTDDDASTARTSFSVDQDSSLPCVLTGEVRFGGAPAGGAIVALLDMATDEDVSMAVAAADGTFALRADSPGQYAVYAIQVGSVTKLEEGSAQIMDVSQGTNSLASPLIVFPGDHTISGRVFASDTGEGFPGVLAFGEAEGYFALAVTDDDGDYSLAVADGEWELNAQEEQVARFGYVPPEGRVITVSGSNIQGVGLMCRRATTLITGAVKDAETQQGLVGISLYAQEVLGGDDGGAEVFAYTGPGGNYKVGVIQGQWWVDLEEDRLRGTGYADPPGRTVNAPASGTVSGIDFLLQKAGWITGYVYEDDAVTPVQDARVEAFEFGTWNWLAGTETRLDGGYTLSVPSGTYRVSVFGVEGFLDQHYLNTLDWEDATPVVVTAPAETSAIDFVLLRAAYVTGHVYEDDGLTPVEGAVVHAAVFGPGWEWAASDQTGPDGSYSLALPAGTYKLLVRDVPGWLDQYYDGVSSDDDATPVEAIAGQETSDIDFVLQQAATISGHVYQEDGTTPLSGAWVSALDSATDKWFGGPPTADDGSYSISVPGGSYRIWARADGWVGEYYDDTHRYNDAVVITVAVSEHRSNINFVLTKATATIKGHVYQQDGTTPIAGASVTALQYATDDALGWTQTAADGSYALPVPPGTFRVSAWTHHYALQYYDHRSHWDATPVTVSNSQVMEDIDFDLQWIPLSVQSVKQSAASPDFLEVQWWWVPGMRYSILWTDELNGRQTLWHEVSDPYKDIVQEGSNGGWMTWSDKGTAAGMNGRPPGHPDVRQRFYKVGEESE